MCNLYGSNRQCSDFPNDLWQCENPFFLMLSNALLIKVCMLIKAEANVNYLY